MDTSLTDWQCAGRIAACNRYRDMNLTYFVMNYVYFDFMFLNIVMKFKVFTETRNCTYGVFVLRITNVFLHMKHHLQCHPCNSLIMRAFQSTGCTVVLRA
jgi:hypothetical protein